MKMRTVFSLLIVLFLALTLNITVSFAQELPQWYLPEGAIARLGNGTINEIVYSPDGSQIAVASSIGIWVYDVDTGMAVALLEGSNVTCIAYSPDGTTIAGCGEFPVRQPWGEIIMLDTVRLWDAEEGTIQQTLPHNTDGFLDLAYSPDGNTIAVSASFDPVRLWDVDRGVFKTTFPEETEGVRSIVYSPSGSTIATLVSNGAVSLWNAEKGTRIKTLAENAGSIAYSPDGSTIVTGGWHDVYIWDAHTGALEKKWSDYGLGGQAGEVYYSPNGDIIAFGRGNSITLWDPSKDIKEPNAKGLDTGSRIINFAYSPDGSTIATACVDLTVRLWDATPEPLGTTHHIPKATLTRHTGPVSSVAYSPDGTTIATGTRFAEYWDPSLRLWDAGTGTLKKTVDHTRPVSDLAYSPDGNTIATAGGFDGVRLWDAETGTLIKSLNEHGDSPEHQVENIAYSPNGNTLAASINNVVSLWNVSESGIRKTLTGHTLRINSVAYSPDSLTVATGGGDAIVHLWSNANGLLLHELEGHRSTVSSIAYSPDGHTIATGGEDYKAEVHLWNAETAPAPGTLIKTLDTRGFVNSVAYSPDGNTLAIGGPGVQLWNAHTGTLEKTFRGHAGFVWSVAYSPDGRALASASQDGTVLLWGLTPSAIVVIPNISDVRVKTDVNSDGVINIQDLVLVAANFGVRGQHPADVNGDGQVNIQDLVAVAAAFGGAAANAPAAAHLSQLAPETLQQWLGQAQHLNLTDATSQRGIHFLEQLLLSLTPKETALLANYPNPFNPETWIPYQVAEPTDVTLHIYAVDGTLVRTLSLGHKAVGTYQSRSHAAYWDGKNEFGEPVASGVYFYTFTAGDFTATRKMLIRK